MIDSQGNRLGPRATLYKEIYKEFYSRNRPTSDRDLKVATAMACLKWNEDNEVPFLTEYMQRDVAHKMAMDYLSHFKLFLIAVALIPPGYSGEITRVICCPNDDLCRCHIPLLFQFYDSVHKAEQFQMLFLK